MMILPKIAGALAVVASVLAALQAAGMFALLPEKVALIVGVVATVVAALAKSLADTDGDGLPG